MWDDDEKQSSLTSGSALEQSYDGVNSAPIEALRQLVSMVNAILADVLKLRTALPPVLLDPRASRFSAVLPDFAHLVHTTALDADISSDPALLALDEEFRHMYGGHVQEVYGVLESVLRYHGRLLAFFADLDGQSFLQSSLEVVLLGLEGKQLLVEALARLSAVLLVIDQVLPSATRERMLVAYYRMQGGAQAVGRGFNAVVSLAKVTGATRGAPWPPGYPALYLQRLPVPLHVVRMIVNKLRTEDIYCYTSHYPSAMHRSTALARQASELYLLLFYDPDFLQKDTAGMRELVDKHFADNWVVSWAPGFLADLPVQWARYKAAAAALNSIIVASHVRALAAPMLTSMQQLLLEVQNLLREGVMSADHLLPNVASVFDVIRCANVVIRWLMLHRTTRNPRLQAALGLKPRDFDDLLSLLLHTADLERQVKRLYMELSDSAAERWARCQERVAASLEELAQVFSGEKPLCHDMVDDRLSSGFSMLAREVAELRPAIERGTVKKVRQLMAHLDDAEARNSIITQSLQTRQHVTTTRSLLSTMICLANLRKELCLTFDVITDFSYGWSVAHEWLPQIHKRIQEHPAVIGVLGCLCVKMSSLMAVPRARIANPADERLLDFYSAELASFVQAALQVVPFSLFQAVEQVVALQSSGMVAIPDSFERGHLAEFAQLPQRHRLAHLTWSISSFTQGLLSMEEAVTGTTALAPMPWVHRGIKTHLKERLQAVCHSTLQFARPPPAFLALAELRQGARGLLRRPWALARGRDCPDAHALGATLGGLRDKMLALSSGLEYLQDYLSIASLTMWQQACKEVVHSALTLEIETLRQQRDGMCKPEAGEAGPGMRPSASSASLSHVVAEALEESALWTGPWRQAKAFPRTFLGRLAGELLRLSDPLVAAYDGAECAWLSRSRPDKVLLARGDFAVLQEALFMEGLRALDALLCLRIHFALADSMRFLTQQASSAKSPIAAALCALQDALADGPTAAESSSDAAAHLEAATRWPALRTWASLLQVLASMGQGQLLRRQLAAQMCACAAATSAPPLQTVLQAFDAAALQHHRDQAVPGVPRLDPDPPVDRITALAAVSAASAGCGDPARYSLGKVQAPKCLAAALVAALVALAWSSGDAAAAGKLPSAPVDHASVAAGVATVLTHCPLGTVQEFLRLASKLLLRQVSEEASNKQLAALCNEPQLDGLPRGITNTLDLLLASIGGNDLWRSLLGDFVPPVLLSAWKAQGHAVA